MTLRSFVQGALGEARYLPGIVGRRGRRSALLGALLLAASTATVLATANTTPTITSMTANTSQLNAGEALIITGTFADPDVTDAHTIFVNWHDGVAPQGQAEKVQLAPGQNSFQLSHTYPIPVAQRDIVVQVGDRQTPFHIIVNGVDTTNDNTTGGARDSRRFPLVVGPAEAGQTKSPDQQPSFVESSIKLTKTPGKTGLVSLQGDWTDGDDNAGIVTLVPSDGQAAKGLPACTSTAHHFKCMYQFPVPTPVKPKTWVYALDVSDGRGGHDLFKGQVQIP
jgi:hypothetical protein